MKTKVLYDTQTIEERIKALGKSLSDSYTDGKPILCVGLLRGAFMFLSELVRHIKGDVLVDFVTLSSYSGAESTGTVNLVGELREDVSGKHVIIIEDIVDSGRTVKFLREYFGGKGALSVKVACLIDKPMTRKVDAQADYVAFTLDRPAFIVGYGLDYDQRFRNLADIEEIEFE